MVTQGFGSEITYLLDYTEWDRARWESWFQEQGPAALAVGLGPNADGRIRNVGELVRHIFSAEQRYVERIRAMPLTDTSVVPADNTSALFAFGRQTRQALRDLLRDFAAAQWDVPQEIQIGPNNRSVTPKTMIVQAVTHEIRHWAQIATLVRMDGLKPGAHDFLISGVFERNVAPGATRP